MKGSVLGYWYAFMFSLVAGVYDIQFAPDFLVFPKASTVESSGAAAGIGVMPHLQARADPPQRHGRALSQPPPTPPSPVTWASRLDSALHPQHRQAIAAAFPPPPSHHVLAAPPLCDSAPAPNPLHLSSTAATNRSPRHTIPAAPLPFAPPFRSGRLSIQTPAPAPPDTPYLPHGLPFGAMPHDPLPVQPKMAAPGRFKYHG